MSTQTHDDGFHEIQLNGKQLVFLFMAATVVSVVIFLCGVLVGRGVQAEQARPDDTLVLSEGPNVAPSPAETARQEVAPAVSPESDPRRADAPPAVDDLSYSSRPEQTTPAAETRSQAAGQTRQTTVPAAAPVEEPPPPPIVAETAPPTRPQAQARTETQARAAAPAAPAARTSSASANAVPQGSWTVQVAALNRRPDAEAVAKRLVEKGYSAYVMTPGDGTPSVFRVRVGPFNTRREADNMAARLAKEEQFKPWVTR